jgi:hypothetical protein
MPRRRQLAFSGLLLVLAGLLLALAGSRWPSRAPPHSRARDAAARRSRFAATAPSVALDAPGFCSFEVALDDQLSPTDVAAPELFAFPGGDPASDTPRDPCDVPGSGCGARPRGQSGPPTPGGPAGDVFDDPDPVPGCDVPRVSCGG